MGAQVVGTELQGWASILAQQAMQHALGAELRKQQGFRLQATGQQFQQLPRQGAENANAEVAQGSAERQNSYNNLYNYPNATGADKAAIQTEGKSRADLAGYGDWQTDRSLDLSHLGGTLGRINSRAAGEAQVFPYRMNRAQHSQDTLSAIGQAISSLGGGASNIAGTLSSDPNKVGSLSTPSSTTGLSGQQYGAFRAGYGPVNTAYASSLYTGGAAPAGGSQYITSLY